MVTVSGGRIIDRSDLMIAVAPLTLSCNVESVPEFHLDAFRVHLQHCITGGGGRGGPSGLLRDAYIQFSRPMQSRQIICMEPRLRSRNTPFVASICRPHSLPAFAGHTRCPRLRVTLVACILCPPKGSCVFTSINYSIYGTRRRSFPSCNFSVTAYRIVELQNTNIKRKPSLV